MKAEEFQTVVDMARHLIAPYIGARNVVDMSTTGPTILKFLDVAIDCTYLERMDMYEIRMIVKVDQAHPRDKIRITHLLDSSTLEQAIRHNDMNIIMREINSTIKQSIKRLNDTELSKLLYE